MIVIPDSFIERMRELQGEQGIVWSEELPKLITKLASNFDYIPGTPFANLSYNFLLRVNCINGIPAVFKASFLKEELSREVSVLKAFIGLGAIQVLDVHEEWGVVL